MKPPQLQERYHYHVSNKPHIRDYYKIELLVNGDVVLDFPKWHISSGEPREIEGFKKCLEFLRLPFLELEVEKINDYED